MTVATVLLDYWMPVARRLGWATHHNFLQEQRMNALLKNALAVTAVAMAAQASAQITFYEQNGFQGQSFTTSRTVDNLARRGFNDRASSAVVAGERWEVCEDARFSGRCVVLRPGQYPSLNAMGLNNRITSVRAVSLSLIHISEPTRLGMISY